MLEKIRSIRERFTNSLKKLNPSFELPLVVYQRERGMWDISESYADLLLRYSRHWLPEKDGQEIIVPNAVEIRHSLQPQYPFVCVEGWKPKSQRHFSTGYFSEGRTEGEFYDRDILSLMTRVYFSSFDLRIDQIETNKIPLNLWEALGGDIRNELLGMKASYLLIRIPRRGCLGTSILIQTFNAEVADLEGLIKSRKTFSIEMNKNGEMVDKSGKIYLGCNVGELTRSVLSGGFYGILGPHFPSFFLEPETIV